MRKPEKVVRNGMVAVLISPGFGGGWSTWSSDDIAELLLFDRRFVEAADAGVTNIEPIAIEVTGEEYICCDGWRDIQVKWLPVGTRFAVEEYDGSESLRMVEDLVFTA